MNEQGLPGDRARASVLVRVPPDVAFRVFTDEIDRWWRRGLKYRVAGGGRGIIQMEPGVGGRLFESFDDEDGPRTVQTGRVTRWAPPSHLVFEWRGVNFAPEEKTEVEVEFAQRPGGTLVTVTHRGWSRLPPEHPARHGQDVVPFIRMMGLWWGELLGSMREYTARR